MAPIVRLILAPMLKFPMRAIQHAFEWAAHPRLAAMAPSGVRSAREVKKLALILRMSAKLHATGGTVKPSRRSVAGRALAIARRCGPRSSAAEARPSRRAAPREYPRLAGQLRRITRRAQPTLPSTSTNSVRGNDRTTP